MQEARPAGTAPGTDLFSAVGRHIVLFLAPIVVLAGLGVAYGLAREPRYTAESRVSIGQLNLTTQGLPGFLTAANNLAQAYARVIGAPPVAKVAGRRAGVSEDRARAALTAAAVPNTPLFRIEAKDPSRTAAVKLANGGAEGLIRHVLNLNRRAGLRSEILTTYNSAALKVAQLERRLRQAGTSPESVRLNARLQQATLRRNALGQLYNAAAAGEVTQNLLQVVAPAVTATSDRKATLQRFGLVGGLAGLLLGLALAAGRESALRQRAPAG